MNSKEALIDLVSMGALRLNKEAAERLAIVQKDLDVLEVLKNKMSVEIDYYDSDFGCEAYEYIAYNGNDLNIDTQEEFNLLKEWLRNAK